MSVSAINHIRTTAAAWFHPHISRVDGSRLLEGCETGTFILRESSMGGNYALSVVLPNKGGLGHYLVEKRGSDFFCLQGSENLFASLEELLAHYCHNDSIGMPCRLRLPTKRGLVPLMPLQSSQPSSPLLQSKPALPPRNSVRGSPRPLRNQTSSSIMPRSPSTTHASSRGSNLSLSPSSPSLSISGSMLRSPNSMPAMSSPVSQDTGSETYEDMAVSECGETYEDMASKGSSPYPGIEEGETYEDMASKGSSPYPGIEEGETYEDMASKGSSTYPGIEEGETYEDMAVSGHSGHSTISPHSVCGGHSALSGHSTLSTHSAHGPSAVFQDSESGEMYEDMAITAASHSPKLSLSHTLDDGPEEEYMAMSTT